MIQGTSSSVGKSILVTALCRIFRQDGIKVAPFKAQNMALNSFISGDGGEIGRSQAMQAQAAGVEPTVDMNPVLLKPEADSRSQVVVHGKPWTTKDAVDYYRYRENLWEAVTSSLNRLAGQYDLLVIEGAGSPAEINLKENEIVNMRVARHLNSPVLLAGDIDRGGVFAALTGTVNLLDPEEQDLIRGFIINKFRGDVSLLEPGLEMAEKLPGGRPTVGVIPYLQELKLAQEDSVYLDEENTAGSGGQVDIAVIRLPHISNYDDMDALALEAGVKIRFVTSPAELGLPDACIIPGTKTTIADLGWLRERGFDSYLRGLVLMERPVVGICGGYQMLGKKITDRDGIEGRPGSAAAGLGLLDMDTEFMPVKSTRRITGRVEGGGGFFGAIRGAVISGYEIHMGACGTAADEGALFRLDDGSRGVKGEGSGDGHCDTRGIVWGTYLHGIFDSAAIRRAWLKSLGWKEASPGFSLDEVRESEFDRLADHVRTHLDMERVRSIVGL